MTTEPNPSPTPAPSPTVPQPGDAPPVVAASLPPEGHPLSAFWQKDKNSFDYDKIASEWTARDQAFTQAQERAKAVPDSPEKYEFKLPEDFKAPEGAEFKFDPKDPVRGPLLSEAQALMHEIETGKVTGQQAFSRVLGLQAKLEVATAQAAIAEHREMVANEAKKLGGDESASKRRTSIQAYAAANYLPDEVAEMNINLSTEAGTRLWEKTIAKLNGTGMPARVSGDPPRPAPKTFAERMYPDQPSGLPPASARSA